ncbi:hypothetical protein MLC52_01125 [Sulfurimonas sp. NW15]|uniref:hypothetical protein n=1 Tax=Sulfurimonas sp. NW15 TaxID=2922729 RepID=UPI003DAA18BE
MYEGVVLKKPLNLTALTGSEVISFKIYVSLPMPYNQAVFSEPVLQCGLCVLEIKTQAIEKVSKYYNTNPNQGAAYLR